MKKTIAAFFLSLLSLSMFGSEYHGTFIGNGGGLTNLNATNLTGTIPDARLSGNVVTQNWAGPLSVQSLIANGTSYIGSGTSFEVDGSVSFASGNFFVYPNGDVDIGTNQSANIHLDSTNGNVTTVGKFIGDGSLLIGLPSATAIGQTVTISTNYPTNTNIAYVSGSNNWTVGVSNGVYVAAGDGSLTNHGVGLVLDAYWVFTNATYPDSSWGDAAFAAADADGGGNIYPSNTWLASDQATVITNMSVSFGTNTVITTNVNYGAGVLASFTGDGAGLTNLNLVGAIDLLARTNGVWLISGVTKTFYGTTGGDFTNAVAHAAVYDTVFLGPGYYNLGSAFPVTKAVNIIGSGSSVWDYTTRTFSGGTIFFPGFGYNEACTNVTWAHFSIQHGDTASAMSPGNLFSTNYLGMKWDDISVGDTSTNTGAATEGPYFSGMDIEANNIRVYCEPTHGLVIKGVSNGVFSNIELHDRPSLSTPFDAVIIKSAWTGGGNGDVLNVKIRGLLIDQCHGQTDLQLQCNDTGIIQDIDVDGVNINGTVATAPIWLQLTSPTAVNWDRVTFSNFRVRGTNYVNLWGMYCAVPAGTNFCMTNTTFANWVCHVPSMTKPQIIYTSGLGTNHTYYFNNIIVGANVLHGIDNNVFTNSLGAQ